MSESYVLETLPESIHSHCKEELWPVLGPNPSTLIRLPVDEISDQPTHVYEYMMGDVLPLIIIRKTQAWQGGETMQLLPQVVGEETMRSLGTGYPTTGWLAGWLAAWLPGCLSA